MDEIGSLKKSFLFKDMGDQQIGDFLGICRKVSFEKDQLILQEGEQGDTGWISMTLRRTISR